LLTWSLPKVPTPIAGIFALVALILIVGTCMMILLYISIAYTPPDDTAMLEVRMKTIVLRK
jgi:hypothetical protein